VTVLNLSNERPATELSVDEAGGINDYGVALDSQPTANVTVTIESNDTTVATVNPLELTFTPTNWNQGRIVQVIGVDDDAVNDPDRTTTITHRIEGGDYQDFAASSITIAAIDDDTAGVTLSDTTLTVDEAGGTSTYTLALTSKPTHAVTVTPTSGDNTVATVDPPELTFDPSNWNQPQTVTVTGVNDDVDNQPNRTVAISHTTASTDDDYNIQAAASVTVTVNNNDTGGVTLSETALDFAEAGGTGTYQVVLNTQPTGNVTVTPESSDTGIATVSGQLTFTPTNWNTRQTVTVTGPKTGVSPRP